MTKTVYKVSSNQQGSPVYRVYHIDQAKALLTNINKKWKRYDFKLEKQNRNIIDWSDCVS